MASEKLIPMRFETIFFKNNYYIFCFITNAAGEALGVGIKKALGRRVVV